MATNPGVNVSNTIGTDFEQPSTLTNLNISKFSELESLSNFSNIYATTGTLTTEEIARLNCALLFTLNRNIAELVKSLSILTVDPDKDAALLTTRDAAESDNRNPVTLLDYVALSKQELRSIDDGGLSDDRLNRDRGSAPPTPWTGLIVQEFSGLEDLDANNLIFGKDFIFDLTYEQYPDILKGVVQKYLDPQYFEPNVPWIGTKLLMSQYIAGLPNGRYKDQVQQAATENGWP